MKTSVLAAVVAPFFAVSGWALTQTAEQKQEPSKMEHMMKEGEGEKNHGGMMRMMKMMDQCSAMMESAHGSEEPKQSSKK